SDIYDYEAEKVDFKESRALESSVYADEKEARRRAESREINRRFGVSAEFADSLLTERSLKDLTTEYEIPKTVQSSPVTTNWIADPDNYSMFNINPKGFEAVEKASKNVQIGDIHRVSTFYRKPKEDFFGNAVASAKLNFVQLARLDTHQMVLTGAMTPKEAALRHRKLDELEAGANFDPILQESIDTF